MLFRSIGIIYKHNHKAAKSEAEKLEAWFRKKGIPVYSEEMEAKEQMNWPSEEPTSIPKTVDCVVVLGGDGTLLGAARRIGRYGVPILGVNMGGLGFLTDVPVDHLYTVIEMIINGSLEIESRVMLETRVQRVKNEICHFHVLNDVVINKSTLARIIDLDVSINGEFLTTFRADGLIIATPTGSTAYNLSAGGPVLYPTMETIILTPICPFALTNRPIIVPDSAEIQIEMGKESEERVVLTFDGQVGFDLYYGDRVIIGKSKEKINLFKPPDYSYFKILRTKLRWGGSHYNSNGND
ncbi:MAG: NAD(+)/NADH kinase [Deltaproteobacteria bacterium]|nr:NAD(+)/NADH kinase [Deltaproteobacteria bacterium]